MQGENMKTLNLENLSNWEREIYEANNQ